MPIGVPAALTVLPLLSVQFGLMTKAVMVFERGLPANSSGWPEVLLTASPMPRPPLDPPAELKLVQEIHDLGLAPFHGADELAAYDSVAIDNVGLGPFETAIKAAGLLVRIAHGQEVDFVVLQKLVIGIAVNIYADAHDSHTLVSEALLQLNQRGHLLHARRAPRSPEV